MREVLRRYNPDLVFIFETHTLFAGTKKFWDKHAYSALMVEEAHGQSGGIWALKNNRSTFIMQPRYNMH